MPEMQKLYDAVLNGDAKTAAAVTADGLAAGLDPAAIVSGYMIPARE